MLNNVNNESILNSSVLQQSNVIKLGSNGAQNAYDKKNLFIDGGPLSDKAIDLYQKDLEIQKYTKMVLKDFDEADCLTASKEIVDLIEQGKYEIPNDDIASAILSEDSILKDLLK